MTKVSVDRCKIPEAFWRSVERSGISSAALLRQARLPAMLHVSQDAWVTTAQYFQLWQALEDLSGDPAIGLNLTVAADSTVYPPATLAAFFAKDFRDGLVRLAKFKRLCTPQELYLTENDGEVSVVVDWLHATGPEPNAAADMSFAATLELGRRGTGHHIVPLRVEMTRLGPATPVHADYLRAPISFGARRNRLVLRTDDLDRPFAGHNPELLAMLTPALSASLDEIKAESSLPQQVMIVLKRRLPSGKPEVLDIANALGMSERTLQRRISASGTSFRQLLELSRQELGREMLASSSNAPEEIAYLLGYQDISSFYRAFREWEGITPAQWRERHMKSDRPN